MVVSARNAGDPGSIPGSGRSPGEGNGNPLSSTLAWKIPWTEKPGGLQSMGSQRVRHDRATSLSSSLLSSYSSYESIFFLKGNLIMPLLDFLKPCKTLMLGGIGGRRRRGRQGMRWLDGITDTMDMSFE